MMKDMKEYILSKGEEDTWLKRDSCVTVGRNTGQSEEILKILVICMKTLTEDRTGNRHYLAMLVKPIAAPTWVA